MQQEWINVESNAVNPHQLPFVRGHNHNRQIFFYAFSAVSCSFFLRVPNMGLLLLLQDHICTERSQHLRQAKLQKHHESPLFKGFTQIRGLVRSCGPCRRQYESSVWDKKEKRFVTELTLYSLTLHF